ncbi:hypothetical protein ABPH35_02360 [Streptococcus sp. ZJ93]|uniref:hypothetical protein n=1 Tax=Streptococcus handemini TaxID=3161188 RepID=UPI0034D7AF01
MEIIEALALVAPTALSGYFGYLTAKSSNLSKQQFEQVERQLGELSTSVENVQKTSDENNAELKKTAKGVMRIHRYRLQENMRHALKRGWTTQHELDEIAKLYESYIELGGNGAITVLYNKFIYLPLEEEEHD